MRLFRRTYAIQGNAVAVTPEPAALSLCGTGLSTVAAVVRRRRPHPEAAS